MSLRRHFQAHCRSLALCSAIIACATSSRGLDPLISGKQTQEHSTIAPSLCQILPAESLTLVEAIRRKIDILRLLVEGSLRLILIGDEFGPLSPVIFAAP